MRRARDQARGHHHNYRRQAGRMPSSVAGGEPYLTSGGFRFGTSSMNAAFERAPATAALSSLLPAVSDVNESRAEATGRRLNANLTK